MPVTRLEDVLRTLQTAVASTPPFHYDMALTVRKLKRKYRNSQRLSWRCITGTFGESLPTRFLFRFVPRQQLAELL